MHSEIIQYIQVILSYYLQKRDKCIRFICILLIIFIFTDLFEVYLHYLLSYFVTCKLNLLSHELNNSFENLILFR